MKRRLKKRMTYLYTGELSSMILFVWVSSRLHARYPGLQLYSLASFWGSFIFLEFLLLQGTVYWYAKLKSLKKEKSALTPKKILPLLEHFKALNIAIIGIVFVAFMYDSKRRYAVFPAAGLSIALFVYIFAIVEFINYFYIQLSYDNLCDLKNLLRNKKLKESSLHKALKRKNKVPL